MFRFGVCGGQSRTEEDKKVLIETLAKEKEDVEGRLEASLVGCLIALAWLAGA